MKKPLTVVLPLLAVGIGIGWWTSRAAGPPLDAIVASGTIEATDADLGFQAAGRVLAIDVREGERVAAGSELARLDARGLEAELESAGARLEAARARLAELEAGSRPQEVAAAQAAVRSAESRARTAEADADRAGTLFEGGAISRQALDRARTEQQSAVAALDQAREALALAREGPRAETMRAQRAAVAQAAADVSRVEAALDHAIVTAPFDGIVTRRHREPGESVAPAAPVLTLMNPDDRWVRIYVRQDRIGRVRLGAPASIASDSHPDRTYRGEVVFIGSEAEFTPRNVQTAEERTRLVYPVKVRIIGDAALDLKPGVPADVRIETDP